MNGSTRNIDIYPDGTNGFLLQFEATVNPSHDVIGKLVTELSRGEYIQIENEYLLNDLEIWGGKVLIVVNGNFMKKFEIPAQHSRSNRVFIYQINKQINEWLKPKGDQ